MIIKTDTTLLYRANRTRFAILAPVMFVLTIMIFGLSYDGIVLGDKDVRGAWVIVLLGPLFLWMDYAIIAKLFWPPELEISADGFRWQNYAMFQWPANYRWQDVDGPQLSLSANGVQLLQFVLKSNGKHLETPPSHFGVTYDELAATISAVRIGKPIEPNV